MRAARLALLVLASLSPGIPALARTATEPPRGSRAAQPDLLPPAARRELRETLFRWQLNGYRDPAAAPGPVRHQTRNERRARTTPEDRWGNPTVHPIPYVPR